MFKLDFGKLFKKKNKQADNDSDSAELLPQVKASFKESVAETGENDNGNNFLPDTVINGQVQLNGGMSSDITEKPESDNKKDAEIDGDVKIFSELLGESAAEIKDDFNLHGIRRFGERLIKLNVRYEVKDGDALKTVDNCVKLGVSEILVSPAYLGAYRKAVNKSRISGQKICALIDFPFGESSFKSKAADIKSSLKYGVDGFTVVMPAAAVKDSGDFKSQMKKFGKISGKETGVAFSAAELDAEKIKLILKTAEKAKLSSLTFAFGDETEEEVKNKCEIIKKSKGKTEIRILGNVKSAMAVSAVIALGADKVITPFADGIAVGLAKSFKIKKIKLS